MNCNTQAFEWIIDVTKIKYGYPNTPQLSLLEIEDQLAKKFAELSPSNCLNKMVTSFFLEVDWIYVHIFNNFLKKEFSDVIN
jgi:hypothetical protein